MHSQTSHLTPEFSIRDSPPERLIIIFCAVFLKLKQKNTAATETAKFLHFEAFVAAGFLMNIKLRF